MLPRKCWRTAVEEALRRSLRLNRQVLEDADIAVGDLVDVAVRAGVIVVAPVKRVRGRHNLRQLIALIPKDYRPKEVERGTPAGRGGMRSDTAAGFDDFLESAQS